MKKFDLNNGWHIEMYKKNDVYFNEDKVAVVDYDNDLIAIVQFEDDKIDFLHTNYNLRPKLLFSEKIIVFPDMPEDE
ncbi:hypothetical protein L2D08_14330 [Domibacillus sp. PGB-M46]|uniref:hypothetical protein n=1 Tax=Domibacillus sp. PGB-M46 TaxID=2910255 RepID=UPI001F5A587C|nr:hypothetical protein [Domibacillus sp. PGB-M46]MCI2255548.1 hypothetical protein [Domibacillus sp. PGB-M46]